MEPVKSRGSKDRIDKRKVPGGDGNIINFFASVIASDLIDKRKVPGGDGNHVGVEPTSTESSIDKRKVPGGDGNLSLGNL